MVQDNTFENPGLQPFELSHYQGVKGLDFYLMLPVLRRHISLNVPKEHLTKIDNHLTGFGFLVSGKLNDLVFEAHQEGKYGTLQKFDRHGNRIDEIIYCKEQLEAKQLAHNAGLVNLDYQPHWELPFYFVHREALAYLSNLNGEAGYNCPLAMTEGMLELLRQVGTPAQQERFLPLIVNQDLKYYFAAGQYLTERVGGSNVSANRTIAKKLDNGKYSLTGEKWFCSNPGEVWVTTARIENTNTIGAFLVGRRKENGQLNNHNILRLKDIIGSRGKATAEIEYHNVEAELIGKASHGLAIIIKHVINVSRTHVGISATAMARRAFWEAREYARTRRAFNTTIDQFSSIQKKLCDMQVQVCAMEMAIFLSWNFKEANHSANEILMPLMKYISTSSATKVCHDAIMIHGGNGIINNYSVLPRLLNDSVINETWEGTHEIISQHCIKAFRKPKSRKAFFDYFDEVLKRVGASASVPKNELANFAVSNLEKLKQLEIGEINECSYLPLCDYIFNSMTLVLFLQYHLFEQNNDDKTQDRPNSEIYLQLGSYFREIKFQKELFFSKDSIVYNEEVRNAIINF